MIEYTIEQHGTRWRVVQIHPNGTRAVVGSYTARYKAAEQAERLADR